MQKKILALLSVAVVTLLLISGAAFADTDIQKGTITITDVQSNAPYGGTFTFSGTITGEGNGPYTFQSIIIGDTICLLDSWKLNKEKQTTFTATESISGLPVGKYCLLLINPVGSNYEVNFQDNSLYYNGTKVDSLDNLLGQTGTDTIIEYLKMNDVDDVYAVSEFTVVENTATSTVTTSSSGIRSYFPFLLVAVILLPLLFSYISRRKRGNMQQGGGMQQGGMQEGNVQDVRREIGVQKPEEPASESPAANEQKQAPAPAQVVQSPGVCPYCRAPLDPDLDFCTKCGRKIQK